jgi:hypothetical protein
MDEGRLNELAGSFYERLMSIWQALPPPRPTLRDRQFWTRHFAELGAQMAQAAEDAPLRTLRRIQQIASQQHSMLSEAERSSGGGRVLRDIADSAGSFVQNGSGGERSER